MSLFPVPVALLAVASGVSLASAAMSVLAAWRAHSLARKVAGEAATPSPPLDAAIGVLQQKLDILEQELGDVRRQGPISATPAAARSGINLDKRSQALRMHRRGDQPSDIAASLGLPLSEVNLLLKVHRIVLRSF